MKLPKNMGRIDRLLRFVTAAIVLTLYFTGVVSGWIAVILLAFAVATSLTGSTGFCPLYPIFGWNTCKVKEKR